VRYDRQTARLLQAVVRLLPADTLIHAYAAILRVLESPFSAPGQEDCDTLRPSAAGTACQARNLVLGSVPRLVGPLAAACLIVLALATNVRLGVFLLAVVAVFIGSTTLQFDPRHTFYLEFIGLWPIAFFLQRARPGGLSRLRPLASRAILVAVVLCAIPAILLIAARAYQQRVLTTLFTRYLAADATSVPISWSLLSTPSSAAVPLDHLLPPLDPFNANAVSPSPTLRSGILRIEVGGSACAGHTSYLALRYEVPFNGQLAQQAAMLSWTVPADGSVVHLFMPIYRMQIAMPGGSSPIGEVRPLTLEMAPTETACLRSLATLDRPSDFPISLMAILGPDWRTHRLYQTLSATGAHNSQTPGYP
jgi:hypothetical protein